MAGGAVRVLVSGFGPFPGCQENPSALLIERLQSRRVPAVVKLDLITHIFPTEWVRAREDFYNIVERDAPHILIHFGVSQRAKGFCIECQAENSAHRAEDACGAYPGEERIIAAGSDVLTMALPSERLVQDLRGVGIQAETSADAGGYLCNYLYYLSLAYTADSKEPLLSCFVHIPPINGCGAIELGRLETGMDRIIRSTMFHFGHLNSY